MNSVVRPDFIPVSDYISKEFLALENERVWPRVWLMACRAEDLSETGSYYVFDVVRDSILLVRQASGEVKAYHNVCLHRGRRLKDGCGQIGKSIFCKYHGWSWNIDGSIQRVVSRDEWEGCPDFGDPDLALAEVRVDSWSGWIFVTMNPDAPSLREYLGEVPGYLDCFELEETRLAWSVTVNTPANWKVVLGAFNEGYHVEATHPQTMKYSSSRLPSAAFGIHSMFGPPGIDMKELPNRPAAMAALQRDPRELLYESMVEMNETLMALTVEPSVAAAKRILEELPVGVDPLSVAPKFHQFNVEELKARGVQWPEGLTPEAVHRAGFGWQIFPNFIILLGNDGILCYRTRPHPEDPDQCVWDIWSFGRYAPGKEPVPVHRYIPNYADFFGVNPFLNDDLINMPEVQKGMYSRGLKGLRTNPQQEACINHLHRVLHDYIDGKY